MSNTLTHAAGSALKWLLAAWIVGSLLYAHGCHGPDEDHELFTSVLRRVIERQ